MAPFMPEPEAFGPIPGGLAAVGGYRIGHWSELEAATGCTVILAPPGTVGGVDVRGGAPGTIETDALRPGTLGEEVHGILLAGGSAFGLAAATGVVRYLEEREIGVDVRVARVPIVAGAVIFDLGIGRSDVRPGEAEGYAACLAARPDEAAEGNAGAGVGATVGKLVTRQSAMKGGLGTSAMALGGGVRIAALVVVNALGDVVDPATGEVIAGARDHGTGRFLDGHGHFLRHGRPRFEPVTNTTIGVVATNARLDKAGANRLAEIAHNGLAHAIRPAHTPFDGDTLFALGSARPDAPAVEAGRLAAAAGMVVADAVVRAVRAAETLHGVPGRRSLDLGRAPATA